MTHARSRTVAALLTLTLAAIPACSSDSPTTVEFQDPDTLTYDPALEVDLATMTRTSSGLYLKDLVVGTGDAGTAADLFVLQYDGWLNDGTLFDSSRGPGRNALTFRPSDGGLITGWLEGVVGMQVGGTRQLVIPPQLAFGARPPQGSLIPAGAVLVFEIELVDLNPGG